MGHFESINDLLKVSGISSSVLHKNSSYIKCHKRRHMQSPKRRMHHTGSRFVMQYINVTVVCKVWRPQVFENRPHQLCNRCGYGIVVQTYFIWVSATHWCTFADFCFRNFRLLGFTFYFVFALVIGLVSCCCNPL